MKNKTLKQIKEEMIGEILRMEGGYVNHPNDPGGETNFGITKAVARENGYNGDMKKLTKEKAIEIYEKKYWDVIQLDRVCKILNNEKSNENLYNLDYNSIILIYKLLDIGVNQGPNQALLYLDEGASYLKCNEDGVDVVICNTCEDFHDVPKGIYKRVDKKNLDDLFFLRTFVNFKQADKYYNLGLKFKDFQFGWWKNRVFRFENMDCDYLTKVEKEKYRKHVECNYNYAKENLNCYKDPFKNIYDIFKLNKELDLIESFELKAGEKRNGRDIHKGGRYSFTGLSTFNKFLCYLIMKDIINNNNNKEEIVKKINLRFNSKYNDYYKTT